MRAASDAPLERLLLFGRQRFEVDRSNVGCITVRHVLLHRLCRATGSGGSLAMTFTCELKSHKMNNNDVVYLKER
jgi:hypothetical protein